jgi:WD40 repeat protein
VGPAAPSHRPGLVEQDQLSGQIWSLAFSADSRHLASATITGELIVKNLGDGHELRIHDGPIASVRSLAFSPREAVLGYTSRDSAVRLWDADTQADLGAFEIGVERARSLAFSPDGVMLAIGQLMPVGGCGAVSVWDRRRGRRLALFDAHRGGINAVAFSPDGKQLAVGDSSGDVTLWEVAGWHLNATFRAHQPTLGGVISLAFSPTGRVLATAGSFDSIVRLWDAETGKRLTSLTATDSVHALGFSPDGTLLATAQEDGNLCLWDHARGRRLGAIRAEGRGLYAVAFSRDGRLLATGGINGIVRLWDLERVLDSEALRW